MPLDSPRAEPTMTEAVAGIASDFQKLMSQQFALFRAEVGENWRKAMSAMQPIVIGAMFAVTGFVMFGLTVALLLYWAMSPAGNDPSRLPLWACFGLASLGFMVIGGGLVAVGMKAIREVNAVPKKSALEIEKTVAAIVDPHGHPAAT